MSSEQLTALRALPCRPDDVFVATWPKAGTHWVAKICNLILEHDQCASTDDSYEMNRIFQ